MQTRDVNNKTALQTTPAAEAHNEVALPEQHQALAQLRRVNRMPLPEHELCRRLWRLYEMALVAANRTELVDEV